MLSVEAARQKAQGAFWRRLPDWLQARFDACAGDGPAAKGMRDSASMPHAAVEGPAGGREAVGEAIAPSAAASLTIGLKSPTEAQALAGVEAAQQWAQEWRDAASSFAVEFAMRRWPSVGEQRIPVRLLLPDEEAIARFAGEAAVWQLGCARVRELAERLLGEGRPPDIRSFARVIIELPDDDWQRLLATLAWLQANPECRSYVRELPVRGIDTKWVEAHRRLVWGLGEALTGKPVLLQLKPPGQMRVRLLDGQQEAGGMLDFAASPTELMRLSVHSETVVICENLVSLMTLPELPDAIGLHGSGFAVSVLAEIPWVTAARVLYWGDLDSNGFAILNRLRSHIPATESVMMDAATLELYHDLCVAEETPFSGQLAHLTPGEEAALALLLAHEPALRLEQERIPYTYICEQLRRAL